MTTYIYFYDLEGLKGGAISMLARTAVPEGEYGEYQFKGEAAVRNSVLQSWTVNTAKENGTPCLFRLYSPVFGSIIGFSRVGVGAPVFFQIPVNGTDATLFPLRRVYFSSPNPNMTVQMLSPFVADDKLLPTVSTTTSGLPSNLPLIAEMEATYLDGNTLHPLGSEQRSLAAGVINNSDNCGAAWGVQDLTDPDAFGFTTSNAPTGPLHLRIDCEGYGSDKVRTMGENLLLLRWFPLMSPPTGALNLSGPTPSEQWNMIELGADEGDFIRQVALPEKLLGKSRLFTNLSKACDVNADGITDISDYVVVTSRSKTH